VNGLCDRVEKALRGVGSEIDDDLGLGGDGRGDFNVEHHFAIGSVRVSTWRICRAVHQDARHRGRGQAQAGKVRGQVGGLEAAAQLDDPDALPCAVEIRREVVELGDLDRRELCFDALRRLGHTPQWKLALACSKLE
jgi:hypothetical protein